MDTAYFYNSYYTTLEESTTRVLDFTQWIKKNYNCIEHISHRIKDPSSVEKKLIKRGYSPTLQNAKEYLTDLVGIRLVCRFVNDIYTVSGFLQDEFQVIAIKDYIANPKSNGYRSYHMILNIIASNGETVAIEIQLRTISQDSWACLEHQIKYKKIINNEKLIRDELKRCADELAATDLCMQTIREFIDMGENPTLDDYA